MGGSRSPNISEGQARPRIEVGVVLCRSLPYLLPLQLEQLYAAHDDMHFTTMDFVNSDISNMFTGESLSSYDRSLCKELVIKEVSRKISYPIEIMKTVQRSRKIDIAT